MVKVDILISLVPLFPLLGFLIIALRANKMPKGITTVVACGALLFSFLIAIYLFIQLLAKPADQRFFDVVIYQWIGAGSFAANIGFLIDSLSSLMLLIITGVGFLIHIYSVGYMHDDEGYNKFFSYLNLFVFFMLLLVMGSNYLLMFVGWEGVGLCSYLLIGFWFKNKEYTNAANKAFIMNRIGDLGLIIGVVLIFVNYGSIEYKDVFAKLATHSPGTETITLIAILLFVGAMGKSAQVPLYTWLPDAMAGPTPVSALIHAATMVTAGIYMVSRNSLMYTLAPMAQHLVLVIGLITALFAATIAVTQNDIKKVLAYSTVSQLGLIFVALGAGAFSSAIFHMTTHAFFKALLFLGAGSVIHGMGGEQDIRKMGGLKKYLPVTWITFFIGVLAISGIPPFAGFFSKDEILSNTFAVSPIAWAIALLASLLTSFYMFRLFFLTFYGKSRASEETLHHAHESPSSMTMPLIALAVLSVVGGWIGIPEVLHGSNWIGEFLSPVFAQANAIAVEVKPEHGVELALMGAVVVLTLILIVVAWNIYVSKNTVPAEESAKLGPVHSLVYHKYYIDELYDNVIVKPLYWISSNLEKFIEKLGIDGIVNSVGGSLVEGSKVLRLLQTGNIGFYIFAMVISIAMILAASFFIK